MSTLQHEEGSRREFFRSLGRYGVLGALGGAVGWLMSGRRLSHGEPVCDRKGYCLRCRALDSCGHPVAKSARAVRDEGQTG